MMVWYRMELGAIYIPLSCPCKSILHNPYGAMFWDLLILRSDNNIEQLPEVIYSEKKSYSFLY